MEKTEEQLEYERQQLIIREAKKLKKNAKKADEAQKQQEFLEKQAREWLIKRLSARIEEYLTLAEGSTDTGFGESLVNKVKVAILKIICRRLLQADGLDFNMMKASKFAQRGRDPAAEQERHQAIRVGIEKLREMKQRMDLERLLEERELN